MGALYRVADAVRPGQTDPGTVSGPRLLARTWRMSTPVAVPRAGRGRHRRADRGGAGARGPRRAEVLTDALAPDGDPDTAPAAAARTARLTGLLDLAWTEDAARLRARVLGGVGNVVLTGQEEGAYQRTVGRLNGMLGARVGRRPVRLLSPVSAPAAARPEPPGWLTPADRYRVAALWAAAPAGHR